jgi:uncharacterized protein YbaR (Trm112 family)
MNQYLLDVLACPICKGQLYYARKNKELICRIDRLAYPIREGTPVMIEADARELPADEDVPTTKK